MKHNYMSVDAHLRGMSLHCKSATHQVMLTIAIITIVIFIVKVWRRKFYVCRSNLRKTDDVIASSAN